MLANLALASFIKFHESTHTAVAVTVIMGAALLYFLLSHGRWMRYVTGSGVDPGARTLKVWKCHRACDGSCMCHWGECAHHGLACGTSSTTCGSPRHLA